MYKNNILDEFNQPNNFDDNREKYSTLTESNTIYINSKDRNCNVDSNYNFSISFSPGNDILNSGFISKNYKNIKEIELINLVIPNIYVDIEEVISLYSDSLITSSLITSGNSSNNVKFKKLSDLPYLLLNINELNSNVSGTNKELNKSTHVLVLDDIFDNTTTNSGFYTLNTSNNHTQEYNNINNSIIAESNRKILKYKNLGEDSIKYYPQLKSNLKNLKISLTTPNGKLISNLNDYLDIDTIKLHSSNNKIEITLKKYFCTDEYSLGDKIIIKNISVPDTSGLRRSTLESFLSRNQGHTIIGHNSDPDKSTTKLYNKLFIPFDYLVDLDNGSITRKDNFGLTSSAINVSSGRILNTELQILLSFKIITEKRDNSVLHSNVI